MRKYSVELAEQTYLELQRAAEKKGIAPDTLAADILNVMLVRPHSMNEKEMAEGYLFMGEINLALAKE